MGAFDAFTKGLQRARQALGRVFTAALRPGADPATLEELEQALLAADLGPELAAQLVAAVRRAPASEGGPRAAARAFLLQSLSGHPAAPGAGSAAGPGGAQARPQVTLLLGVNGSGKTTTAGKLAWLHAQAGEKVLLGAADTFRAAAADQLQLWAERSGAALLRQAEGADPAAVAFDAVSRGVAGGFDRVIIDTAGRLQTKVNLMEELRKVHRVCGKALAGAPHTVLLVLDGTSGQNMLSQARLFNAAVPLGALAVTKLDGTAKAGALVTVASETGVPVRWVGLGESAEDLRPFDPEAFVDALLP